MNTLLTALAFAALYCFGRQRKAMAPPPPPENNYIHRRREYNMYTEAGWLSRFIGDAATYERYCEAEDRVNTFADTYNTTEGVVPVLIDLLDLLERARVAVRRYDNPRMFDFQYNEE